LVRFMEGTGPTEGFGIALLGTSDQTGYSESKEIGVFELFRSFLDSPSDRRKGNKLLNPPHLPEDLCGSFRFPSFSPVP
jgi:hypothetical protein